jgi:Ca2+-binding RTX toxin-like protein
MNAYFLQELDFKSRFLWIDTQEEFNAAIVDIRGMLSAQSAAFAGVADELGRVANSAGDLSGQFESAAGKAEAAAAALNQISANVAGMLLGSAVSDEYIAQRFPASFDAFLMTLPIGVTLGLAAAEQSIAQEGITRSNYAALRQEFIDINSQFAAWESKSADLANTLQNASTFFVLSEVTGTVVDAVSTLNIAKSALSASSTAEAAIPIARLLWRANTTIASNGESFGNSIIASFFKALVSAATPQTQLLDQLQSDLKLKVLFFDETASSSYSAGFVNDVLFVAAASSNASVNFDLNAISTWGSFQKLVVIGSGQNDSVIISELPFGEAVVSTAGGIDTIKIGVGAAVSPANVKIDSGADNDTIEVQAGSADIKSGGGVDTISLFLGGEFTVDAGGEKDTIRIGDIGSSIINGGAGEDTVDFSGKDLPGLNPVASGVKFNLAEQGAGLRVQQGGVNHTLVSIENIILTQFEDEVTGDGRDNIFEGLGGDDTLVGGGGNDTLDGGENYDTVDYSKETGGSIAILAGGANISVIDGSGGRDTLIAIEEIIATGKKDVLKLSSMDLGVKIDLGEGEDTVDLSGAGSGVTVDLYSDQIGSLEIRGAENIIGTSGADTITGNDQDNIIVGNAGKDEIDGGLGNDTIYNGDATGADDGVAETLYGDDGDDTYFVGVGDTVVDGDGVGKIIYKGKMLSGGIHPYWDYINGPDHIDPRYTFWKGAQGEEYQLEGAFGGTYTLNIFLKGGGQITVLNFSKEENSLGIVLEDNLPNDRLASPLVIDLDGDGVQTTTNAGVYFDVDNDGLRELTGWATPTDGLLALDVNQNGRIDDSSELFGYGQTITWPSNSTPKYQEIIEDKWTSGFGKLAALQTVFDGVIDAQDAIINSLKVWRDADQDGETDDGELLSLADLGIAAIGLDIIEVSQPQGNNFITDVSGVTMADGSTRQIADVWFGFDQQNVRYDKPTLTNEIKALPYLAPIGAAKDMRSAAATDPVLAGLLSDLTQSTTQDLPVLFDKVEDVLLRWLTKGNTPNWKARGEFVDAVHLAALEARDDTPFVQYERDPRPVAGAMLEANYRQYVTREGLKLVMQTELGQGLFPEITFSNGLLVLETNANGFAMIDRLAAMAPQDNIPKIGFWSTVLRLLDPVVKSIPEVGADLSGSNALFEHLHTILAAQGINYSHQELVTARVDGSDAGRIFVPVRSYGAAYGATDNPVGGLPGPFTTIVASGAGNDEIRVSYNKRFGIDKNIEVIWASDQGNDQLVRDESFWGGPEDRPTIPRDIVNIKLVGLLPADVSFSSNENLDLIITNTVSGETFSIRQALNWHQDIKLTFADGVTYSAIDPRLGSDLLFLQATEGDDALVDAFDVNLLEGKGGNDRLFGEDGDDIYSFGLGDGYDQIFERVELDKYDPDDMIRFKADVQSQDVRFSRFGDELQISIAGTGEKISIWNEFKYQDGGAIETLEFSDGTTISYYDIVDELTGQVNFLGVVHGWNWSDTFNVGSDPGTTFNGGAGADIYRISNTSGTFTLTERHYSDQQPLDGTDEIRFNAKLSDVTISRTDADLFEFSLGVGNTVKVDTSQFWTQTLYVFGDTQLTHGDMLNEIARREQDGGITIIRGTSASETLAGTELADEIHGGGGADTIVGGAGDDWLDGGIDYVSIDTISGGAGNDFIQVQFGDVFGGTGDDTILSFENSRFQFGRGDGQDVIFVDTGIPGFEMLSPSIFLLGDGIVASDLRFSFVELAPGQLPSQVNEGSISSYFYTTYGLKVEIANTDDSFTVFTNGLPRSATGGSVLMFSDDSTLSIGDIVSSLRAGTNGNQLIVGSQAEETLSGGLGDDTLVGQDNTLGVGDDTFAYQLGDGNDIIVGPRTSAFGSTLAFGLGVDPDQVTLARDGSHFQDLLVTLRQTGETILIKNQFVDVQISDEDAVTVENSYPYKTGGYIETIRFEDASVWTLDDILIRASAPTTGGDDNFIGSATAETIDGGLGNDTLAGGVSADTYIFGLGSGSDTIIEDSRETPQYSGFDEPVFEAVRDELRFGVGLTVNDLVFAVIGSEQRDLQVRIKGTADSVLIKNQFSGDGHWGSETTTIINTMANGGQRVDPYYASGIEFFSFADGTRLTRAEIETLIVERPNTGNDLISTGFTGGVLDGGTGSDMLNGGSGDDIYVFGTGYGEDVIKDAGGQDIIKLRGDVDVSTVAFSRSGMNGKDLLIEVDGVDRLAMTVTGQFEDPNNRIEKIIFENGATISAEGVENYILQSQISSGNDTIKGFSSSENIFARDGDDQISSGGGSDFIDGGEGWDVVQLEGPRARYSLETDGDRTTITDLEGLGHRVVTKNVEVLRFSSDNPNTTDTLALAANLAPIVGTAIFVQFEDSQIVISANDLLQFASDPDGGSMEILSVSNSLHGTIETNTDGNFVFTPDLDFVGTASFDYVISDAGGLRVSGTATITYRTANDVPLVANKIEALHTPEDRPINFVVPSGTFADQDGDTLSLIATMNNGDLLPSWLNFDSQTQTFSGQPPGNYSGILRLKLTASDGAASVSTGLEIIVDQVNDLPILNDQLDPITLLEGQSQTVPLPADFVSDVDDTEFSYFVSMANGAFLPTWISIDRDNALLTIAPPRGASGTYAVTLSVFDGQDTATTTIEVSVGADNRGPSVSDPLPDVTISENESVGFTVPTGSFTDVDGDALTYTATLSNDTALPEWLAFDAATQVFTGTPPVNFNGSLDFKVTASDGSLSASDIFTLDIMPVNDAPVVTALLPDESFAEDSSVNFTVPAGSFSDVDGDTLNYTATLSNDAALPEWLAFNAATRVFTGTPPVNFNGSLDVKVTASDGSLSASDVFTLAVTPVNDAPVVATLLPDESFAEDSSVSFSVPAGSFTDVDGDALTYTTTLSNGSPLPAWLTFNATVGSFTGTPPANFNGSLDVKVTASDGSLSVSDIFTLAITAVNDAPVVVSPVADRNIDEDTVVSIPAVTSNFSDLDGDTLVYSAKLAGGAALPSWLSINAESGAVSGTLPADYNGVLTVDVTASDGQYQATDQFVLTVAPINDAPVVAVLIPDTSSPEDQALNFNIPTQTFFDVDGNALTLSAQLTDGTALPAWLTFNASVGSFTGTPPANFNGNLNVKVTASDGTLSTFDTFVLAITPVNDAPVMAQALADITSPEDTVISFALPAAAFTDVDSALSYTATLASGAALPSWLSFNATTRQFTGTPPANFNGLLDIKVTASDGALSASDVFSLTVSPVNDNPVAVNDGTLAVANNTALTITAASLLGNDSDIDGDALTIQSVQGAQNGTVALNAGSIVFTPTTGYAGAAAFTYTVTDGKGGTATGSVALTVAAGGTSINGTAGADILNGGAGAETFYSFAGNDIINANGGNDTVYAGDGADIVNAGDGNDTIFGDAGNDIINGNVGDDTAYGGAGADILNGSDGNDILYGDAGIDILNGDAGNDTLYGGADNDTINASTGNDTVFGDAGNDIINGDAGIDALNGGDGADTINGGTENDTLTGAAGNDLMNGGAGNDTFVFAAGFGKDTISGFQAGSTLTDVIKLSLGTNFDTFAEVIAATGMVGTNAVITITPNDTITLTGVNKTALVANDFLFV